MPRNSKFAPTVGDIVHITFWDHAQDADDALLFEIFGRLTATTPRAYVVHYWQYCNELDAAKDENKKHNEDRYAIVKKAIQSIRVLK